MMLDEAAKQFVAVEDLNDSLLRFRTVESSLMPCLVRILLYEPRLYRLVQVQTEAIPMVATQMNDAIRPAGALMEAL